MNEPVWSALAHDVRRFVARRAPQADVDDLVQDILERAHAARDTVDPQLALEPWLFTLARNVVIDHLRKRRPESLPHTAEAEASMLADDPHAEREEQVWTDSRRAMGAWLVVATKDLASPYREAIVAVDIDGQSQRAAAEALGVPYSTLKSRVQRGRAKLHASFIACCHVELDRRGGVTHIQRRDRPNNCACCS